MKKLLSIVVLVMVTMTLHAQQRQAVKLIRQVSAKDVKTIIDTTTTPTIINFWATWCGPCIREIPWFDSIITEKRSPVKLLLVSLDFHSSYPAELTSFVKEHGYKAEVLYLNETNSDYYISVIDPKWNGAIPASIFINKGKKYYQLYNQQLPPKQFVQELDKLVN